MPPPAPTRMAPTRAATFAVVTGGGTAGHVIPALAIAEALHDAGHPDDSIHYVGAARGIERRLLPDTPYPHTFLDVIGFQRSLSRRNVSFLPKLGRAIRRASLLLRQLDPAVVVSVGGYASLPSVLAARRLRIPVVVVSFDRTPGRASAVTARFAAACAVAFEGSSLPRAVVTGAPVRRVIRELDRVRDRDEACRQLGLDPSRFVLAFMGGSLGSGVLNDAVARFVAGHRADSGLAVRHVAGERFVCAIDVSGFDPVGGIQYQVVGYEDRMDLLYAAADLVVGRGGATTVAEVATAGVPAVLVPWADSAEDHQTANVAWLADQGAAVSWPERDIRRLGSLLDELRRDPPRRQALADAARAAGARHRAGGLAALIERVAGRPRP